MVSSQLVRPGMPALPFPPSLHHITDQGASTSIMCWAWPPLLHMCRGPLLGGSHIQVGTLDVMNTTATSLVLFSGMASTPFSPLLAATLPMIFTSYLNDTPTKLCSFSSPPSLLYRSQRWLTRVHSPPPPPQVPSSPPSPKGLLVRRNPVLAS